MLGKMLGVSEGSEVISGDGWSEGMSVRSGVGMDVGMWLGR